jgi:hypothetical protein
MDFLVQSIGLKSIMIFNDEMEIWVLKDDQMGQGFEGGVAKASLFKP